MISSVADWVKNFYWGKLEKRGQSKRPTFSELTETKLKKYL